MTTSAADTSAAPGALAGIRVLDLGLLVQGPQAAAALADLGAQVLKIELPGMGDHSRLIVLGEDDFRSAYFSACNRGKRSLTLDLRTPAGAAICKRLVEDTDVIISNFKPGTLHEWGLGYDDLSAINPGLIWAAGSAFGAQGPDALREGADLAGQCAGGLISTIGSDGQDPSPVGVTIADHIASQNLTIGVLAALMHRQQTGRGQKVEVSLLGGPIWAQASEYSHLLMTGEVPGRANLAHPLIHGLYRLLPTADGWIGVIGVPPDARDQFFIALNCPELSVDSRFSGMLIAKEHLPALWEIIEKAMRTRTTEQWSELFREIGVRYAPVRDYREAAADPGAWANGYFQKAPDLQGEHKKIVGNPINLSDSPTRPAGWAPTLGQHTDEVLTELGYSAEEIAQWRKDGVV